MKRLRIFPGKLNGKLRAPSSKSMGHRELICAGLANGVSVIENLSMSKDMEATLRCLKALGISAEEKQSAFEGRAAVKVTGTGTLRAAENSVDCGESGSTLRFFLPLAATLKEPFSFFGRGRLAERPLQAYYDIFNEQKVNFEADGGSLPLTVRGGLRAGVYKLPGNISSQYVSGLLFCLPLLEGDSEIVIEGRLESAPYADMTVQCLKSHGISVERYEGARLSYFVKGCQEYKARDSEVEGDWSQAAFWLAAGALGEGTSCEGLDLNSSQGDKIILKILKEMGVEISTEGSLVTASASKVKKTVIDASDCPDIVPVLAALAAFGEGTTEIVNAGRLRIKECDRLSAISKELNKTGAEIIERPEGLTIHGKPEGLKGGVKLDAHNDHRIAMSLAVAASACEAGVELSGADSVEKSYPDFWKDFEAVGGRTEVIK